MQINECSFCSVFSVEWLLVGRMTKNIFCFDRKIWPSWMKWHKRPSLGRGLVWQTQVPLSPHCLVNQWWNPSLHQLTIPPPLLAGSHLNTLWALGCQTFLSCAIPIQAPPKTPATQLILVPCPIVGDLPVYLPMITPQNQVRAVPWRIIKGRWNTTYS